MTINGINGANTQMGQMGMNQTTDSYSRNIQNQIATAQKQMQDLSSNNDLTLEEKMKKKQEIQQEISNLNQQLRQHQIEQRKEQQSKGLSMDDMLGGNQSAENIKSGSKGIGLSQASMQAMISADSSMKQAQVQSSVATNMEGKADVLKSEIQMDKSRGLNTEKQEAELAEIEQKATDATASQINMLASANQAMRETAKAEQDSKADKSDTKTDSKADKSDKDEQEIGRVSENTADSTRDGATIQTPEILITTEDTAGAVAQTNTYARVDIRL